MKLQLEKERDLRGGAIPWMSAPPFVENRMAVLIHRPRSVTTRKIGPKWGAHLSVHAWCGNTMNGSGKFTFMDAPPGGKLVCARCEEKAVAAGIASSSSLVGYHVHTGGVVAVARCCTDADSNKSA